MEEKQRTNTAQTNQPGQVANSLPSYHFPQKTSKPLSDEGKFAWVKKLLLFLLLIGLMALGYYGFVRYKEDLILLKNKVIRLTAPQTPYDPTKLVGVKTGHLKIDSILFQLTKVNPQGYQEYAKRYELTVIAGKVRVEIEIEDPKYFLPPEIGDQEETHENFMIALVKIDKLVELADDPNIIAIRIPPKKIVE